MGKPVANGMTWVVVLLVLIGALIAGIALGWFDSAGSSGPAPTTTVTPTDEPTPTANTSAFVERPVTVAAYVPTASTLTETILDSVGSGWVVAIDDTTQIDTADDPYTFTPGDRILYLIAPAGDRYELANLTALGLTAPDLAGWDYSRDKILMVEGRSDLVVFDMATGAIANTWTFCSSPGWISTAQARSGNWLVRGHCQGTGIDGVYTDSGTLVPSDVVGSEDMVTVVDVGSVQVLSGFETGPDERFIAHYADGTTAAIPSSMVGDCYMMGQGRGDTLAVYCYSLETGRLSVWELPVDLSAPHQVISAPELIDFAWSAAAAGPHDFLVTGYCSDSALPIVQVAFGDDRRLGVLYGGTVEPVGQVPFRYRVCHACVGTAALVSGDGHLWWVDFDTGTDVTLLPGESAGSPIQVVGTDGYRALRQP